MLLETEAEPIRCDLNLDIQIDATIHRKPTPVEIITAVIRYYGVSEERLIGPSRSVSVVYARHVAFWLCRALTEQSLEEIGRDFGGRHHTTIMCGVRRVREKIERGERAAAEVAHIMELVSK